MPLSVSDYGQGDCAAGSAPEPSWCDARVYTDRCTCPAHAGKTCLVVNRPFSVLFLAIACAQPPCVHVADSEFGRFVKAYDSATGVALSAQFAGFSLEREGGPQQFLFPGHSSEYAFAPPANAHDSAFCLPVSPDAVVDLERTELYENTLSKFRLSGKG